MSEDPHDLERFVRAQQGVFDTAVAELGHGRKSSHWMWFVFPQLTGLGRSPTAQRYALDDLGEARAYLAHPVLGPRLLEASAAALAAPARSVDELFGGVDAMKLRSSMTLFAEAATDPRPFRAVLDRWFGGTADPVTLRLLRPHD
ncbi:DUF1810 domain-containing protein [Curtobacterium sp. AB451]|uniref:DUF1810 domain-containing protein n=1 Tax=Curtobacterium sp. AB451 TaxID=3422306 RepID=UPI003D3306D9